MSGCYNKPLKNNFYVKYIENKSFMYILLDHKMDLHQDSVLINVIVKSNLKVCLFKFFFYNIFKGFLFYVHIYLQRDFMYECIFVTMQLTSMFIVILFNLLLMNIQWTGFGNKDQFFPMIKIHFLV